MRFQPKTNKLNSQRKCLPIDCRRHCCRWEQERQWFGPFFARCRWRRSPNICTIHESKSDKLIQWYSTLWRCCNLIRWNVCFLIIYFTYFSIWRGDECSFLLSPLSTVHIRKLRFNFTYIAFLIRVFHFEYSSPTHAKMTWWVTPPIYETITTTMTMLFKLKHLKWAQIIVKWLGKRKTAKKFNEI